MVNFQKWLDREMEDRRLTRAELARMAKISQTSLSLVYSGKRNPGKAMCTAIAAALKLPPEEVFREAGLLPAINEKGVMEEKAEYLYQQLNDENKQKAIEYLEFLNQQEDKVGNNARSKKSTSSNYA